MCGQRCPDYTCPLLLKSAQSTSFVLSSPLSSPDGGWVCDCCVSSSLPCMVASWGCGCLPLKDCTFLPGILSVSCSKNDSVHHLPTRKKSLPVLDGVGRAKIWKIFEMYKIVYLYWINHFPHIEAAQPRFLGLWGRHKFVCTSGAVLKSQKSQANSNTKSTGRLYVDKYASSAENESSD